MKYNNHKKVPEKRNLDDIRNKFMNIVDTANNMYYTISNINPSSTAIYDADRSMKTTNTKPFDIKDKHRFTEIQRELRRAEQFLNDAQAEGFNYKEPDPNKWSKMFGNQYKAQYGQSYSPSLNDEYAKLSFEAYRRVESDMAAQIEAYGSDTLIQYIYDYIDITPSLLFMNEDDRIENIKLKAQQMIIDMYNNKVQGSIDELKLGSEEYGILQSSKSAQDLRNKLNW